MILALPARHQGVLRSENMDMYVNRQRLEKLLEICNALKGSQFSLLSLLYDFTLVMDNTSLAAEDIELVAICIGEVLNLPNDNRATSILPLLALQVRLLRGQMLDLAYHDGEENEVASTRATRVINSLMTRLAHMTVFGGSNNRMLSCARSRDVAGLATGWLSVYIEWWLNLVLFNDKLATYGSVHEK